MQIEKTRPPLKRNSNNNLHSHSPSSAIFDVDLRSSHAPLALLKMVKLRGSGVGTREESQPGTGTLHRVTLAR